MTCRQKCVRCGDKFWDLTDDGYCAGCNRRKYREDVKIMVFVYVMTLMILGGAVILKWLNS